MLLSSLAFRQPFASICIVVNSSTLRISLQRAYVCGVQDIKEAAFTNDVKEVEELILTNKVDLI